MLGRYVATGLGSSSVERNGRSRPFSTSPAPILTSLVEARACVADHLSFRERLVRRQAEKEHVRAGAEFPSSSALAIAPGHETEVVTPRDAGTLAGSGVPDASSLPAGSPTTPILVEDKERAADSMPPPPARKEIVLALRAPSVVPVAQPKGRKRKFTKGGDGESLQQGGLSIASGLHGKDFRSLNLLICGSETSRLAGELLELQGRWSETEAMLTAVKDSHSVKVLKLEVAIGKLERDLGKTASSLLKEKKARKAKSSEVRRLQRQIEGDAGLASRGIREATDALRSEFQARLAKISAFLGSLECIRNRDLALATIEGGVAVVQSFQSETPPTLEAEEARLSGCKGDLAVVDGDFDLILADLKSACFLPTCSEGPEGKDPVLGESGGDAAPGLDEATGEEGALRWISEDVEYKHRCMVLGSRIFSISCFEMLETSALGLGQDLGLLSVLRFYASETPPTLEAEEARLSGCKGDLAVVDGDFDLILADLKSACFLPTCLEGPEGKDPVLGESGGDAAPGLDESTGEEGA
ncbi:hypothetical protein F2Q68_00027294 [Brassica cretica]|uniref:Uncharacterized protein n=1 Tax=Brassica cretica TaxID=69181 RepID=A0A8S9IF95_BRACR|nr:hypothetical protein F2Q68_00027294 [Brassica cretica]